MLMCVRQRDSGASSNREVSSAPVAIRTKRVSEVLCTAVIRTSETLQRYVEILVGRASLRDAGI
jgi:hypothetical protein